MNSLGFKINQLLGALCEGISARDIAEIIGASRKEVNQYLYAHPEEFIKDDSYIPLWSVCRVDKIIDPVMSKLQNYDGAKRFSREEFNALANWKYGDAFDTKHIYITKTGNVIECDSKSEMMLLEYLESNNLVQEIGGQMLRIRYSSEFRSGRDYYPDIVALTNSNHIVIFEVKAAEAMSYHLNMEKYRALAEYSEANGYLYVMIDPALDFITYEEIRDMEVSEGLLEMFDELEEEKNTSKNPYLYFDDFDVDLWYEDYGEGYTKKEFKLQVHSLILYYEWYNVFKHGFNVYSRPVKRDENHNVIDYI